MDMLRGFAIAWALALGLALGAWSQTRQISVSAYGGLYEDSAGTVITVATGGDFYQWTSSTVGPNHRGVTPSAGTDNLTVDAGSGGVYLVMFEASFAASVAENIHWHAFLDGASIPNVSAESSPAVKTQTSLSSMGLVELPAGSVVDLRVTAVSNGTTVTVTHASLVIVKVS